jgi:ABC-2 type transport system permease protein
MFRRIYNKKNRALLAELVRTDFRLRYQGSALGYAWTLLQPLFFFIILYVVFSYLKVSKGIPYYAVYLLIGIVLWSFFREITSGSITSIVGRGDLIRKIRIPRWIIILSSTLSALINLGFNLIILVIFLLVSHADLLVTSVWFPLLILEIYILAAGVSLFLSAAYVKYRDVSYIWDVIMQGGFYLTPIIYLITAIPNVTLQKIIMISPMSQAIQDSRYALIWHGTPTTADIFNGGWLMYIPFVIVVSVFILGVIYFRNQSKYFAENI